MNSGKIRFVKEDNVEISNRERWVVFQEGSARLARFFGGRTSRSGYTHWPEWVEEGAFPIKPLRSLTEEYLLSKGGNEDIIVFSGSVCSDSVYLYHATVASILHHLSTWKNWRNPDSVDFQEEPYCGSNHATIIARAVSFNVQLKEGMRLTNTEVSRHSQSISMSWDEGSGQFRWDATLRVWPFKATSLDYFGEPRAWFVYKEQEKPSEPPEEDIMFVEED